MADLVWGIKNGELDQVKDYIEKTNVDLNNEISGRCPVHYAADYGQKEILEFLISKGVDVNLKDKHGITALLAAIWEGHTECVRLLLANGAVKEGTTPDGTNYIDAAEKDEIKELLR
ncbi:myotrophin [Condylostylus longicornis]|uniref:myotrophin n=1 Tax=Condylostylus longicornis TaxID=2530218 RepID=UPI00244DAF05|nr:myotrophin [Condylostylus longicornis]